MEPDMPQPLRRWYPMAFRNSAVIERPALGAAIAQIAAAWTEIEVEIGLLLAIMLDSHAKTGVHMYLALTGSAAQDKTLIAAAETRLPTDLQSEFIELLDTVRTRAAERNKVIHAIWAVCPKYPNDLIHCPPDHFVRDMTHELMLYQITGQRRDEHAPSASFVNGLMRYTLRDFEAITQRINALQHQIRAFSRRMSNTLEAQRARALALAAVLQDSKAASPQDGNQTSPKEQP